tara:strand:- start:3024 stop:3980 length:957 start_codon:yes stop_codon:yes gene_type:complete
MKTINFFSSFHTGDIFATKSFVKHVMEDLTDFDIGYYHSNHPKIMRDLNIKHRGDSNFGHSVRFVEQENTLNINTWIGAYCPNYNPAPPHCQIPGKGTNLNSLSCVWQHIFDKINSFFGTSLVLKQKLEYIPTIDYSFFNTKNHKKFIEDRGETKKILFCNGIPMSGQSIPNDMSSVINHFAQKYPSYDFICTKKISTSLSNVFFTDDILVPDDEIVDVNVPWNDRMNGICDLNEISYLSTHCNLIIGKQSGPFCYCITKENLMNPDKYIIAFSKTADDGIACDIDIECDYLLSADHDLYCNDAQYVIDTIGEKLCLI